VATDLQIEPWLKGLLGSGTMSVLIAETREEYVARAMTDERRHTETAADIARFTKQVRDEVGGAAVLALDQEPWGIQRLHDLVPAFPAPSELVTMTESDIVEAAAAVAAQARRLGVTMFLSPVLDVLTGPNPWLHGRTLELDHEDVGRIAAAFVRGVQRAGVVAVAKHFPGYPALPEDPALHDAVVGTDQSAESDLEPFIRVIRGGVRAVMTGPAIVQSVDPDHPSSTSARTIALLRAQLGFAGLVVSDDLDAPSTTKGRSLAETAVASLLAGADLLLVPGGPHLEEVVAAVRGRAATDGHFASRLADASARVRSVAAQTEEPG
jgi:beta-N-acetylhexosaminidase